MKALTLAVCATLAAVGCASEPTATIAHERANTSGEGAVPTPGAPSPGPSTDLIESPTTSITSPPVVEPTTTTEAPAPPTTVRPVTTTVRPTQLAPVTHGDATMDALSQCESGDTNANTGNGYFGFLQFSLGTWRSMGESGYPTDYSRSYQFAVGWRLQARSGWSPWPACARSLGLL